MASLVPADVSTYTEVNLDRMLGKTPETAALGEALSRMQSLRAIRNMLAEEPEVAETFGEILGVLTGLSQALGPRVGLAMWLPDTAALLGGMTGGEEEMAGGMRVIPKVLVVAEVRDKVKLDALVTRVVERLGISARTEEGYGAARVISFAEGMVELIRSEEWMVLAFPPEEARNAAERVSGKVTGNALSRDRAYQRAMEPLPVDAAATRYMSAESVKQTLSMMRMLMPSAELSYGREEAMAVAMGVRVEEKQGRQMVTAYATADVDTVPYLMDAAIGLQAAIMYPMLMRSRENARKAVCLSNMKNLALAAEMFAADNEGRLPDADHWVEQLMQYIENEEVLRCPADASQARSSYGMNHALSGKPLSQIEGSESVVLFYETAHPGDNPSGGPEDVVSPRHIGGNVYAFADAHTDWLQARPSFGAE